jgi:hypothetical protein
LFSQELNIEEASSRHVPPTLMDDRKDQVRSAEHSPRNENLRASGSSVNQGRSAHEPLRSRTQPFHSRQQQPFTLSSPISPSDIPHSDMVTSPTTPSKRSERIFPISSVVPASTSARISEPSRSSRSSRSGGVTPSPSLEYGNPFDGDSLYVNFNEELDRQRLDREAMTARYAAAFNSPGASHLGMLQHPMTIRFQHKETDDGHCVVTVRSLSIGLIL